MSNLNREWHENNLMPKRPTFEERLVWHREHQKHCQCRPGYPEKLKEEAFQKGIRLE